MKKPLVYGLRASQFAARQPSKLIYPLDGSIICCEEGRIKLRAGELVSMLSTIPQSIPHGFPCLLTFAVTLTSDVSSI